LRKLILAASLLAIAAPAAAQPRHDPRYDPRDEELLRHVPSAYEVDRAGRMLARVTDALMDIDIGPVADAVDPARRYDRRYRGPETLGDLASRDDPYARERLHDEIRATTTGLGAVTEEVAIVTPMLRRSIEDAARRLDAAMRDRDYRRYRDDYPYDRR
jgi:hypothetical protein